LSYKSVGPRAQSSEGRPGVPRRPPRVAMDVRVPLGTVLERAGPPRTCRGAGRRSPAMQWEPPPARRESPRAAFRRRHCGQVRDPPRHRSIRALRAQFPHPAAPLTRGQILVGSRPQGAVPRPAAPLTRRKNLSTAAPRPATSGALKRRRPPGFPRRPSQSSLLTLAPPPRCPTPDSRASAKCGS